MYQVILINDETRGKNYYYSYVESSNSSLGNVEVNELPPYADINKARSCYYENQTWTYDNEKYTEIVNAIYKEKNQATYQLSDMDKLKLILETIPTDYPEDYDHTNNIFPEKIGYKWRAFYSDNKFVWELVVDEEYQAQQAGKDYLNPIVWEPGMTVTEGLWYDVDNGTIWQAKKTGVPESAEDTEYFDIP